jgi:hypothetical protein
MKRWLFVSALLVLFGLAGCAGTMNMKGESAVATEVSSPAASTVVAQSVQKCDSTMLLDFSEQEASNASSALSKDQAEVKAMIRKMAAAQRGFKSAPSIDPKPLVRAALESTGCFVLVDNDELLNAAKHAQELKNTGYATAAAPKKDPLARYSVIPEVSVTQEGLSQQEIMNRAVSGMNWGMLSILTTVGGPDTTVTDKASVILTFVNNQTQEKKVVQGSASVVSKINMGAKAMAAHGDPSKMTDVDKKALVLEAIQEAVSKLVALVKDPSKVDRRPIERQVAQAPSKGK